MKISNFICCIKSNSTSILNVTFPIDKSYEEPPVRLYDKSQWTKLDWRKTAPQLHDDSKNSILSITRQINW